MSIYRARYKRSWDGNVEHTRPPYPVAAAPGYPAPGGQPARDWEKARKSRPADYLLPTSLAWFKSLPPEVRPVALVDKYARIANLIARHWHDYAACTTYFDELLHDRRGGRKGFPSEVYQELRSLHDYYVRAQLKAGRLSLV
jgi:hypothetical protein